MKRALLLCLCALLLLSALSVSAGALTAEQTEAAEAAEQWLRVYTAKVWLLEDCDLNAGTIAELPQEQRDALSFAADAYVPMTMIGQNEALSLPGDAVQYLLDKAECLAQRRQLYHSEVEHFEVSYLVERVRMSENCATVSLRENKSFSYQSEDFKTTASDVIDLFLVRVEGRWLVCDALMDDGFDVLHKAEGFSLALELELMQRSLESGPGQPIGPNTGRLCTLGGVNGSAVSCRALRWL